MKKQIQTAKPTRRSTTATVLTREVHERKLTCPECGGTNGLHRLNQPCDWCSFTLRVQLFPDHSRYCRGLGVTASGRDTYDIGDATADDLRGLTVSEVIEATAKALAQQPIEIGLSVKLGRQFKAAGFGWNEAGIEDWLEARYEGRNVGMIRMNCGNILRNSTKRANPDA